MFCRLTETLAGLGTAGEREWAREPGGEGDVVGRRGGT
jgi:hypothetical protein